MPAIFNQNQLLLLQKKADQIPPVLQSGPKMTTFPLTKMMVLHASQANVKGFDGTTDRLEDLVQELQLKMESEKISTVQELMDSTKDRGIEVETVPERYVRKHSDGADSAGLPSVEVPIIDLGLLSSRDEEELLNFRSALCSWGCFQVINHGMEVSYLDQVREVAKQFFAQPSEEKLKYLRADDGIEGYGNDMVLYDQQVIDWNDRLYLSVYPEDHQKLEFWPTKPENFRQTLDDYTLRLKLVVEVVFKGMARSLNLESNSFWDQYGESGTMFARFNFYPRCPRPELVYGLKPHADGSAITVVLPDKEVEGLQFLRDGKWVMVPINPHALLINIGDQVEIMSNGVFKSPIHRALTNSQHDRISLAMFCAPEVDREIGPVEELLDDSRPRMYKNVKNYPEIYFHYYQQQKRPIDSVKL